jgi:hypothetical protein
MVEMINKVIDLFYWGVFQGSQSVIPLYIYRGRSGPVPRRDPTNPHRSVRITMHEISTLARVNLASGLSGT